MVLEVRTNTGKIFDDGNADLFQLSLGSNTGGEEELRSAERSLRDDGLLLDADDPARTSLGLPYLDRGAAARTGGGRVEDETSDLSAGEDREVLARIDALGEIGGVRGGALSVVDDSLEASDLWESLNERESSRTDSSAYTSRVEFNVQIGIVRDSSLGL